MLPPVVADGFDAGKNVIGLLRRAVAVLNIAAVGVNDIGQADVGGRAVGARRIVPIVIDILHAGGGGVVGDHAAIGLPVALGGLPLAANVSPAVILVSDLIDNFSRIERA